MSKFNVLLIKALLVVNCLNQTNAQQAEQLIEVKCYVELIGGERTIHHAMISPLRLNQMRQSLLSKKILLTTDANQREVHKVLECTQADNKFKNIHAVALQKRLTY
mgnify:CR=1 FL=1